jgi:hypothetical protein
MSTSILTSVAGWNSGELRRKRFVRRSSVGGRRGTPSRERGRTLVFTYNAQWEGTHYEEKEVTVYFKSDNTLILLTAIARYGSDFPRHPHES